MCLLKASRQGLEIVEQAMKKRGWKRQSAAWFGEANVGLSTLKRFWKPIPIGKELFISICNAVGVNWEEIAESTDAVPIDWSEPFDISAFWGRDEQLDSLRQKMEEQCCRLILLWGRAGIGKTALLNKFWEQHKSLLEFDYVIQRSLRNPPPLSELLADLVEFIEPDSSANPDIFQLMKGLRRSRCLLIFDDWETMLQGGKRTGTYKSGYIDYQQLLRKIGRERHQSCVIVASGERLRELDSLQGKKVQALELKGLQKDSAQKLLNALELTGSPTELERLNTIYGGNPLSLKLVAALIRELFNGQVASYTNQGTIVVVTADLLEQQFSRLSELEINIMRELARNISALCLRDLANNLQPKTSELIEALRSLRRRSLIEKNRQEDENFYSLQPEIRKYIQKMYL